jgi:hypothetical protein
MLGTASQTLRMRNKPGDHDKAGANLVPGFQDLGIHFRRKVLPPTCVPTESPGMCPAL